MAEWGWDPNTITAVATAIAAAATGITAWIAIVIYRQSKRDERPDVSAQQTDGTGLRSQHPAFGITTTVRNPSRRTMKLRLVALELPSEAVFLLLDNSAVREIPYDRLIAPLDEAPYNLKVRLPAARTPSTIKLRFEVESPVGGKIVQEHTSVQVGG